MDKYYDTGVMCMVSVPDPSREEGFRLVDMGNYYRTNGGKKAVFTANRDLCRQYSRYCDVPVYLRKQRYT